MSSEAVSQEDGFKGHVEMMNSSVTTPTTGTVSTFAAKPASKSPAKYRHVAAVHSRARTSLLSTDHEGTTSFMGFRNLMVLVLSKRPRSPHEKLS